MLSYSTIIGDFNLKEFKLFKHIWKVNTQCKTESFIFRGNEINTEFARYVVEYLTNCFKNILDTEETLKPDHLPKAFRITRNIKSEELGWDNPEYRKDSIWWEYTGHTYGCISPDGIACSIEPGKTPFHEIPKDALEMIIVK